jgi:thioredoxin-related protein
LKRNGLLIRYKIWTGAVLPCDRIFKMRKFAVALFALMTTGLTLSSGQAGIDRDAPVTNLGNMQLIVMEAEGCIYCGIFRRDVLPSYEVSERGKDLPVRFLDVNDVSKTGIELQSPIDILPTFVITKDNREIGRIPGYMGPEDFFHSIAYLLSSSL